MKNKALIFGCILGLGATTSACSSSDDDDATTTTPWALKSTAFTRGAPVPPQYTCNGGPFASGDNPPLEWTNGPAATKSYAIALKDLSVIAKNDPTNNAAYQRGFHYVIWDIPAGTHEILSGQGDSEFPPEVPGARQWANRGQFGYFPPCPNADPAVDVSAHVTDNYSLILYALDKEILDYPAPDPNVTNYSRTLVEFIETVAIGETDLPFTSNAASSEAPQPGATIIYPSPRP